jgi:hypothetical protein
MSATLFLAFCILGCDFLLYFLFQWTYGERRRGLTRRSAAPKGAMNQPDARPFLIASRKRASRRGRQFQSASRQVDAREAGASGQFNEVRAYRRIAASFGQAKR